MKSLLAITMAGMAFGSMALDSVDNTNIYISENSFDNLAVEWVEPDSFSDVRDNNFSSERFRKRVFKQIERHLNKLASKLPEGQSIKFSITDLDLAGQVAPASFVGFSNGYGHTRVLRDIDIPRINFTYTLNDKDGKVVKSDTVTLRDMNYLSFANDSIANKRAFYYEKRMLEKWFKKNLLG